MWVRKRRFNKLLNDLKSLELKFSRLDKDLDNINGACYRLRRDVNGLKETSRLHADDLDKVVSRFSDLDIVIDKLENGGI